MTDSGWLAGTMSLLYDHAIRTPDGNRVRANGSSTRIRTIIPAAVVGPEM